MTLSDLIPQLHYPTRLEKLVDGWVHGVALGLFTIAVFAALGLAIWQGGLGMAAAVGVYAICVITMIGCSMAYNLAENHKRKSLLRRFDHAAIFLMIAGTYTPFTLVGLRDSWGFTLFGVVWGLALAGVVFKLYFTGRFKGVSTLIFIGMGWLVLVAIKPMLDALSLATLGWLLAGGIAYTLGTLFYMAKQWRYSHAIWHGFVLAGGACHFVAVFLHLV